MSQIDLRLVQAAIAVAEERSFSRAAYRLHLTQPGITKQIQDLESILGVVLFERNNQRVELTEPCRVFLEHAYLCLFHLERAVYLTRAADKGAEAVVNFGSSPYTDPYLVSTFLSVRLPLFPTLRFHTHSNFSHELIRQVATGELDIAVVASGVPNANLNFLEVATHPLFVVQREEEPAAQRREVTLSDYNNRAWVLFSRHVHPSLYDAIQEQATVREIRASETHYVTTAEEAAHLIAKHDAVAFLTRSGAWRISRDGLTMRPMSEPELQVRTVIVTRLGDKTRLMSEYLRAAVRRLQQSSHLHQRQLHLAI